ncbi:LegC family aminotransferase [Paenibacillus sp. 1011MAR3C5]|uniref:LegC family aminotransferase n=1 Tax=Paenibacillus sp. 1011MAR3C5 TaxID=1675787 RepID=UPI000E6CB77B|nr:LegC family aminotransferase [Paenibacillus sp. 1011MAR3C5]RJE85656.1 LegC family aminotransferase [Paenibacillus sp. 1011MAR3C5]
MAFIPLSVPNMAEKEQEYVLDAVSTGWVSSVGPYVERFEKGIASYINTPNAVACQSGTAGLHLSLIALGAEAGDLIMVPTLTFIAAVNPVRYISADPVFLDCDDSLCIDPKKLRSFCEECCYIKDGALFHKDTDRRIPVLVVVHVFGNMADMPEILKIAEEFHFKVLEDATEALGTKYLEGPLNGCMAGTMGHLGVYSFNGNKIITTGGGGMVVSQNAELLQKIKYLSTQAKNDELYFIHHEIGYNYRMTNVQAAIGVAQLERLETFIATKKENYKLYKELLEDIPNISIMPVVEGVRSNYWMYSVCFENSKVRDDAIKELDKDKIQTRPVWGLIHEQNPYINNITHNLEKANFYGSRILNIPCSSGLTIDDVKTVSASMHKLQL